MNSMNKVVIKWVLKKRTLTFHLIFGFLTFGLWWYLYLIFKFMYTGFETGSSRWHKLQQNNMIRIEKSKHNKTKKADEDNLYKEKFFNENDVFEYNQKCYEEQERLQNKYSDIINKHYDYTEKIGMIYTVANNLYSPKSPEMDKCIELCLEDIKLAPVFRKYNLELAKIINKRRSYVTGEFDNNYNPMVEHYPAFSRLAIIYEKQKEYQKAINICKQAIELGFYKDGTTGQLPGRIARLIKKAGKENIAIEE